MSLSQNTELGKGGSGLQGSGPNSAAAMIKELQGLNVSLLAGAGANTTIALAAIRKEDTIISAINNNAGVLTDITANMSINDCRATGTVAVGTVVAGDKVSIAGLEYTLVSNATVVEPQDFTKVKVGSTAQQCSDNLVAVVNAREAARDQQVSVANAGGLTVTVTAMAEGATGNAIALTETGTTFTISGATLTGGTVTGGIKSTSVTQQVLLTWFNKK